jgi:hypothetical protein
MAANWSMTRESKRAANRLGPAKDMATGVFHFITVRVLVRDAEPPIACIRDSLAFGLGAFGLPSGSGGGTLAFLCSAVRTHGSESAARPAALGFGRTSRHRQARFQFVLSVGLSYTSDRRG